MEEITQRCSCVLKIVDEGFSCRGSQGNVVNTVVFRGKVIVLASASFSTADDVVGHIIADWVESSPTISVAAVTLAIDPNCPAMLDSFNSADCVIQLTPTLSPTNHSSTSSSSSSVFIGAGVAVGVLLAILIVFSLTAVAGVYIRKVRSK